jgi:hypothetical protein
MEDILRDGGLKFSENVPASLTVGIAILSFLVWGAIKSWNADWKPLAVFLGILIVGMLTSVVPAWSSAQKYCEEVWVRDGTVAFATEKCQSISDCDDSILATLSECGPPGTPLAGF